MSIRNKFERDHLTEDQKGAVAYAYILRDRADLFITDDPIDYGVRPEVARPLLKKRWFQKTGGILQGCAVVTLRRVRYKKARLIAKQLGRI